MKDLYIVIFVILVVVGLLAGCRSYISAYLKNIGHKIIVFLDKWERRMLDEQKALEEKIKLPMEPCSYCNNKFYLLVDQPGLATGGTNFFADSPIMPAKMKICSECRVPIEPVQS